MMDILILIFEFFKIGLFSVGGVWRLYLSFIVWRINTLGFL